MRIDEGKNGMMTPIHKRQVAMQKSIQLLALSALAAVMCGWGHLARADGLNQKCDRVVSQHAATRAGKGWSQVIVRFTDTLTAEQEGKLTAIKAGVYRHLPFIQSAALRIPDRNIASLAALPFVKHISSDFSVKKCDEFTV